VTGLIDDIRRAEIWSLVDEEYPKTMGQDAIDAERMRKYWEFFDLWVSHDRGARA